MRVSSRDPDAGTAEELRERLRVLTEEVARNELLLRKTQAREIELLRAHSLGELFDRIVTGLRDAYALDLVTLSLFDPQHELRHLSGNENLSSAVIEEVRFIDAVSPLAPQLAQFDRPWLGPLHRRRSRIARLAGDETGQRRADPAAARQPRHWRDRIRQPRSASLHRRPGRGFSRAPRRDCRDQPGKRGESRPPGAQRGHRFPDRLAQPPLFPQSPARRAGARRSAPARHWPAS